MGRTILLDAKPLCNLLAKIATGRLMDDDQRYFPRAYELIESTLADKSSRLLSTPAVAVEALHFLFRRDDLAAKVVAVGRTPVGLRQGLESDLNDFGKSDMADFGFADYSLIRAWQSLFDAGVHPLPLTVTTDLPLRHLASGRYQQNIITISEIEGQPDLY